MLYLKRFGLPTVDHMEQYLNYIKLTCVNNDYPYRVFLEREVEPFEFEPITMFCGGNGSGKTTLLNVIAQRLGAVRDSSFNRSSMFDDYVAACKHDMCFGTRPDEIRIITSDDVFDFMLDMRAYNDGVDNAREEHMAEFFRTRRSNGGFRLNSMEDYEELKRRNDARRLTMSRYVKMRVPPNVKSRSNGESAYAFFTSKILENGLYLLDEPENSLSAELQAELLQYLEDAVRFFGCQLIISTHSPFLLSLRGARIYSLDTEPIKTVRWQDIPAVRTYYDFFKSNSRRFE